MDNTPEPRVEFYKRRYEALKGGTERANWESHCEEIATVIQPRKMGFVGLRTPGEKKMSQVYDPTGIHACELLAAGLHGMATNPSSRWFSLRLADDELNEQEAVRGYLSDVEKLIWARLYAPGANFTTTLHETYMDLGAFGTACIYIGTRKDSGGLLFQSRPMASIVIDENSEGRVDTVYRYHEYTVRQMVEMWPGKVSKAVQEKHDAQRYDERVAVIHVVAPNRERLYGSKAPKDMAYHSCYFEQQESHKLEEGGYPEFPYLVPRWAKLNGEMYGRSPGMTALPDVKMLQAASLTTIKTLQKNADPPLFLPDDGFVGPVRTVPGGLNFYRGQREIVPMPTSIQGLQVALEWMESIRNRIRTVFFADILQIVTETEMTATEVMQRTTERMRILGPIIGRLEAELLGPLIERVFGILNRQGLLPLPPEEIQGSDMNVEYVSPIASAQKQTQAQGLVQVFQHLGVLGPEIAAQVAMQRMSPTRTFDWLWDLFNNDPDLLKTDDEMAADARQQQIAQGMAVAQPAVEMVNQGSQALKNVADAHANGGIDLNEISALMGANMPKNGIPAANRLRNQLNGAGQ
ncbi:MAG: portal protein [Pseudomonadota bacterium]